MAKALHTFLPSYLGLGNQSSPKDIVNQFRFAGLKSFLPEATVEHMENYGGELRVGFTYNSVKNSSNGLIFI